MWLDDPGSRKAILAHILEGLEYEGDSRNDQHNNKREALIGQWISTRRPLVTQGTEPEGTIDACEAEVWPEESSAWGFVPTSKCLELATSFYRKRLDT